MSKENTELKKAGLKATLPRIRILEALESHGKERINSEHHLSACLLYTSPSPRDGLLSRMPSSA